MDTGALASYSSFRILGNKNIQLPAINNLIFSSIALYDTAIQYTYFIVIVPPLLIQISAEVFVFL